MPKNVKIEESNFENLDDIDDTLDFDDIDELDDFGDIADLELVEELDEFVYIEDDGFINPKDSSVGFQKLDPSEYLYELSCMEEFSTLEEDHPTIVEVFTSDKIKALKQVKEDGLNLENLSMFQNDRDVVGIAIINNPDAFMYANYSAQEERIFILEICKEISSIDLGFIPKSLLSDKDFMIELIQIENYAFVHASKDLQNDKETVLVVVSLFGYFLKFASKELRSDREVVFAAIVNMGEAINYASDELKSDKKFILKAIKARTIENRYLQNKGIFYCLSKELQDDEDIVLASIKYDYMTIAYASDKYTTNREIVLEAVKFGGALQFVNEEFQDDKEVVIEAMKNNKDCLKYASKELQKDKDVLATLE